MSAALATTEQQRLKTLEATIERGLTTFVEVGEALMEIRDARLYRPHQTFEDYCRDRWLFSDRRARQLMSAAEIGTIVPVANEAQARELAPLLAEPETLREAWAEASANGAPTAAKVREVVERRRAPRVEVPIDEELLERQQRDTLIDQLDRAVYSLESPPSAAEAEARRLLAGGDAGPFTPSRFERVVAYASMFAETLREAGVDG